MNLFHSARLRLTLWYVLGIFFISVLFSIALYNILASEINRLAALRRVEVQDQLQMEGLFVPLDQLYDVTQDEILFVQDARTRLLINLLIANGCILIFSGGMGYFLAGKTLEPIQEMMNEQNRFISDASHELRTPLTALKSTFEVYLRDKKRNIGEADELIKESVQDVDRLSQLSESLLTLARTHMQKQHVRTRFSLSETVMQAVKQLGPLAKKKHIEIATHVQPVEFTGDPDALMQLCIILIDNAIKYSPSKKTITIQLASRTRSVDLAVIDEGVGIPAEHIPHIFDRFYRVDQARTHSTNGYGLGLSIAKQIVDAHGGNMKVSSVLHEGSTFTVSLPKSLRG